MAALAVQGIKSTKRFAKIAAEDVKSAFEGKPAGQFALVREAAEFLAKLAKEEGAVNSVGSGLRRVRVFVVCVVVAW